MVLGLRGTWGDACKVVGLASLLAAPVLLPSCGSSSRNDEPNGNAGRGSGGSSASGGASGAGAGAGSAGRNGTGGAAGSNATGGAGGAGGAGSGGTGGAGGAGGGGAGMAGTSGASAGASGGQSGDAGSSGSGSGGEGGEAAAGGTGPGPAPGFTCNGALCELGNRCVFCSRGEGSVALCAPDPQDDPAGYQTATASCLDLDMDAYADCDGPEDCGDGEYCTWGVNPGPARPQCVAGPELPDPIPAFCCFTCGSLPECVLCWSSDDCPDTFECRRDDPFDVGGCQPSD